MADAAASKRWWLAMTAYPGAAFSVLIALLPMEYPWAIVAAFVLASLCFELSLGFYNGFLPEMEAIFLDRVIEYVEDGAEVNNSIASATPLTVGAPPLPATFFYDQDGKSLRRAFLRAPVQFRRISSSFARARRHPVLGITRRHQGTDYAASPGTPVMAAGDGVVLRAGRAGGYGNLIELRHRNGITTRYAHLSRILTKVGARVTQGQQIGKVGATGLASGPHLHYEFRVNGVAKDSRKVELGNPISQVYDTLNGFHRFNDWSPWHHADPGMSVTKSGPVFGIGSKIEFAATEGGSAGVGSLEIVESQLNESDALIRMTLVNDWDGTNKRSSFRLVQDGKTRAINVQWDVRVDYGWNILGRYKGMYLDGTMGEDMEESLAKLSNFMATVPTADYSQIAVEEVERTGGPILYVGGGVPSAPRKWDAEALPLMERSWKQVEDFMKDKNITPSGDKLRIINIVGDEAVDASMAYPIPADVEVVPAGNVRIGAAYAGPALKVLYKRNRAGIGAPRGPREALRAFAMTHGYDFAWDGAGQFDEWVTDADEDGYPVTRVYLPITRRN